MRILIIEDEIPASNELISLLKQIDPLIVIENVLRNLQDVTQQLESYHGRIDLIFMDIELQGENILSVLPELKIPAPVIFVTGYNEYVIDTLQHACLYYILKPVSKEQIEKGLLKYAEMKKYFFQGYDHLIKQLSEQKKIRSRVLLKKGSDFHYCRIEEVAFFYSEFRLIFLVDFQGQKHVTDFKTLTLLEEELDPSIFYRANRKFIININSIKKFRHVYRVKLTVELSVKVPEEIVISQGNVSHFKNWIASGDPSQQE